MERETDCQKYDDIFILPHYVSGTRARMSPIDRAAQFSPFAALTGYDAAIRETGRRTDAYIEKDEQNIGILNEKLRMIAQYLPQQPEITVTYFQPDERKSGGAYVTVTASVERIDQYQQQIILTNGSRIRFSRIFGLDSALFHSCDWA